MQESDRADERLWPAIHDWNEEKIGKLVSYSEDSMVKEQHQNMVYLNSIVPVPAYGKSSLLWFHTS